MKTLLYTLVIGVACFPLSLSAQTYQWSKAFVGASSNTMVYGYNTEPSASGDAIFVSGTFEGTDCAMTVDPGGVNTTFNEPGGSGYLSSFSISGQHQWTRSFSSTSMGHCVILELASDAAGNVYVIGGFSGTMDADPGNGQVLMTTPSMDSYFLVKLNPAGEYVWSQSFINQANIVINAGIDVRSNALYIAGNFHGTIDFDNGPGISELTAQDYGDCFVLKLNTDGVFQWVKSYGPTNSTFEEYEYITNVVVNPDGDLLVSGVYYQIGDFNPNVGETILVPEGNSDSYLLKLASNGDFMWAKSSGISGEEINSRVSFASDGSFYHAGTTGEYTANTANEDLFIRKLDALGNVQWSHQIGQPNMEQGISVAVDGENYAYISGDYASQNVDFDPDADEVFLPDPQSSSHPYVARYTPDGHLDRIFTNNCSIGSAFGLSYKNGALYYTGYFFDSIDMDPGPSQHLLEATNSYASSYLVKIDTTAFSLGISNAPVTDFYLFPNPAENQLTIQLSAENPDAVLRLITLQGTVLQTGNVSTGQIQLDVASLTSGVYLIELQSGEHKTVRQFVKK